MLGQYGGDPNKRNRIGCVPLIEVVIGRRLKCIKLLLQAGADPTLEDLSAAALTPTERESDEHCCPPELVEMYKKFFGLSVEDAKRRLLSEPRKSRNCVPTPFSLANSYPDAQQLFRQMAAPRAQPPERASARTAVTIIADMRTHSQGVRSGGLDDALARAEELRQEGKKAFEARDYALALESYEAAVTSLWPMESRPGAPWHLVVCVSNKAESLLQLGEYEAAADSCEDARALIFQHGHLFDQESCSAIEQKLASREARAQAGKERERRREAQAAAQRAEERLTAERAARERAGAEEAARREAARQEEAAAAAEARAAREAERNATRQQEAEQRRAAQQRQAQERQRRAEQVAAEAEATERRAADQRAEEQRVRDAATREEEERAAEHRRVAAAQREAVVVRRRQQRQAREDARRRQQAEALAAVEAERQQALQRAADAEEWRQQVERRRALDAQEQEELQLVMEMSRRDEWLRSREADRAQARAQAQGRAQAQLQAQPQAQPQELKAQAAASSSSADADPDVDIMCPICFEDVVPLWMPCGKHALHISCAAQWRMRCRSGANHERGQSMEPTCPTCREPI